MNEIWKDVIGYENYYQVSDLGRLKTKYREFDRGIYIHKYKSKIMALVRQKSHPYLTIRLNNGISTKGYLVHRLVAIAFLPNPDNKPQVNHKDGDHRNNKVKNLEWVTSSENVKHAFRTGLARHDGANNSNSILTVNDVKDIKILLKAGYKNIRIAEIFGINPVSISSIKHGKQWKHV